MIIVEVFPWVLGSFGFSVLIYAIVSSRRIEVASADPRLGQSLKVLTGLERQLWRGPLRRNLANSRSRFSRAIPKRGLQAATKGLVANLWRAPVYLAFPSINLLGGRILGAPGVLLGQVLLGLATMSFLFCVFRIL